MKVLVSACLLGENCKYSGGNNLDPRVAAWLRSRGHTPVPVCPEVLGGLPVPRTPAEIVDGAVTARDGRNVDAEFRRGAALALETARREGAGLAVLQPRSPSCGVREVYDGSFSDRKIPGMGVFARLLRENGFRVLEPEDLA
ncbi:DUF523 domain-containing protein [uncultured Oscillibacter sp.]|jgi:uncharacterized protein YbbK (DUF523 family)|uniref:DUF523 domain-containing protein n=1 Tax=uncultured Oscillibacter sp. TaxID=876091 RepID=UPI0025D4683C|nr:DUF523 domain-containing protein [uncultured Oscillibacter sp.]